MKKNEKKEINKFKELRSLIEKEADLELRERMFKLANDIETDYTRLKKSTDMKMHVLEIEKEILVDNYIAKDNDINYLYNRLLKIENSKSWKLYQKLKTIKRRVIKRG